ncbi:molybdenum ABC transporter substrate-binding protein [Limnohabitans sp. MMS-10A-160]|uniref:substrate-binding domain-containing protein n=1 Tax=unclassified Limnohabitans TaxID=2626134 RepID=UPI000D342016|nr:MULTISPECIES: substrate-binding domain-containing protein [unclassified Limnohabitans]PUE19164.1 molybdenum ABC transporter substrate-binding protein [Limnohabitans sp. MMS-10A-192]PUE24229.1 molybdenum ABC transporter substrate-binding protein [Limnohabitans sp. MMS-10A-160]
MSTTTLRVISSMATKALLTDLVALLKTHAPQYEVQVESVGGVDAAKRVQAGEAFDCVVLASNAIDKLLQGGQLLPGSRKDLVHSSVAVAIPQGAALVDISTEEALKQAVLHAPTLGISTGPSGVQLAAQFDRWGISEQIQDRMVQAKPGVPVAALIAQGEVALGFQQLSEMMGVPGITVLGPLPEAVQINTTFSGSVAATSDQADAVRTMLAFWASAACAGTKVRHGMQAA